MRCGIGVTTSLRCPGESVPHLRQEGSNTLCRAGEIHRAMPKTDKGNCGETRGATEKRNNVYVSGMIARPSSAIYDGWNEDGGA